MLKNKSGDWRRKRPTAARSAAHWGGESGGEVRVGWGGDLVFTKLVVNKSELCCTFICFGFNCNKKKYIKYIKVFYLYS